MNLSMLMKMVPKDALVSTIKPHIPKVLEAITKGLATAAGAQPDERVGVLFFQADGATMATAYRLDASDQPSEVVGTVDVLEQFNKLDLAAMMQFEG